MKTRIALSGLLFGSLLCIAGAALADDTTPPRHHGPPPEAFAACDGKADGDTCTVTLHDEDHAGTCHAPQGKQLACRPDDMPPPPDRDHE